VQPRGMILSLTMLAAGLTAGAARAEEWQHTLIVYGMGASMDGESQIGPLSVPVDISMSQVFDNLKMGGMVAYHADNGIWSFTSDATYMNLGATEHFENSRKGDVELKQTTLMLTAGRRITDRLEALFGVAYFNLDTELKLSGPLIGQRQASVGADWIDPSIGLSWVQPIGQRWSFSLRGDVGGFGMGSDLLIHALTTLRFKQSDRISWAFGYRVISFDYEENEDRPLEYKKFDITEQGPAIGVAISL
jgi:hypothetical protein